MSGAPHAHAIACGMLRDPEDSVTAQIHGTTTIFKKVVIPINFYRDGVLVYAPLGRGPVDIAVRTRCGQVVSNESYVLESAICR